jgi:IS4 transposase
MTLIPKVETGVVWDFLTARLFILTTVREQRSYPAIFRFAFAATIYNCWRLVDLLVMTSVEDNPDYTPLVTASWLLAVDEGMFGLEKKPPPK